MTNFRPYIPFGIGESIGLAYKFADGTEIKVNYNTTPEGPGVIKRPGEEVRMSLFIGSIPNYMENDEINNRMKVTRKRMVARGDEILKNFIDYAERYLKTRLIETSTEETNARKALMEEVLFDPKKEGLVEFLIRPVIDRKLALGLFVANTETQNHRWRILIPETPIQEAYCLPPKSG